MNKRIYIILIAIVLTVSAAFFLFSGPSEQEKAELTKQLFTYVKEGNTEELQANLDTLESVLNQKEENWTALDIAIIYEYPEIALILYDHGVTTSEPIQFLATNYLSGGHHHHDGEEDESAHLLLEKILKDEDIEINKQNEYGNTVLHLAIERGGLDVIELILNQGADVTIKNDKQRNALQTAVTFGRDEVVKKLSEEYPTLKEELDVYNNTVLHLAVENNRKEIARYLIDDSPNLLNEVNEQGKTPLAIAADFGDTDTVKYLLQQGADKTIISNEGLLAYDYALTWNHQEIADLLK